jgi:hypothetical protein
MTLESYAAAHPWGTHVLGYDKTVIEAGTTEGRAQ